MVRDGGHANRCSGAVARDGNWDDIWIKLEGSYVKERGSTITRAIRARVSRIALADTAGTNSFSVARSCQARASGVTFSKIRKKRILACMNILQAPQSK